MAAKAILMSMVVALAVSRANASSPAAIQAVADATGAALQGDGARAIRLLRGVPVSQFDGEDRVFRVCMEQRFEHNAKDRLPSNLSDPFARQTLDAYRVYWRRSLLQPAGRQIAEVKLLGTLRRLLGRNDITDLDALEPVLASRLRQSGYYSLQGRTAPLRELMIWTRQDAHQFRVELPEGTHTTQVVLLDGFASLGWGDYATCHRRGAGGWATTDALYAVLPRYANLDGEEFRVTFLGHETQHFVDLARFPGMVSWELEYRAKLVELAQASETRAKLLRKFTEDEGDDPAAPHAYANKRVLAALRERLGLLAGAPLDAVDVPSLQTAAAEELRQDSQRRSASSAPAVRR